MQIIPLCSPTTRTELLRSRATKKEVATANLIISENNELRLVPKKTLLRDLKEAIRLGLDANKLARYWEMRKEVLS